MPVLTRRRPVQIERRCHGRVILPARRRLGAADARLCRTAPLRSLNAARSILIVGAWGSNGVMKYFARRLSAPYLPVTAKMIAIVMKWLLGISTAPRWHEAVDVIDAANRH